jgi:AcrR family transcriptional regulator
MREISDSKIPHKSDRRINKTKKEIRHALIRLMQVKDISHISITELAEEADINRKTFYKYYSLIEDVLSEIDDVLLRVVDAKIQEQGYFRGNIDIFGLYHTIDVIVKENLSYHKNLVNCDMNWKKSLKLKNLIRGYLLEYYITRYKDRHLNKVVLELQADYAAFGIIGLYYEWLKQDSDISLAELADACQRLIILDAFQNDDSSRKK